MAFLHSKWTDPSKADTRLLNFFVSLYPEAVACIPDAIQGKRARCLLCGSDRYSQ